LCNIKVFFIATTISHITRLGEEIKKMLQIILVGQHYVVGFA